MKLMVNSSEDIHGGGAIDEAPLLVVEDESNVIIEGDVVDDKEKKLNNRESTGGWTSASFVLGAGIAERFAFHGAASNLVTYLTGPLHQSTATASTNVNAWSGVVSMLPLLGAIVADSYLGRYWTILWSSILYVLGIGLLTVSAIITTASPPGRGDTSNNNGTSSSNTSPFQVIFFFIALYLVAIAQGGHQSCTLAFGADQFDDRDPEEAKSKSSFFNWWACSLCAGIAFSFLFMFYIQENLGWGLGFGIPCICMAIALALFSIGTKSYRYDRDMENGKNPFVRITQVFVAAARNWRSSSSLSDLASEEGEASSSISIHQFKFLNRALVVSQSNTNQEGSSKEWATCSMTQVNEAKAILKLAPIWFSCLVFAIVNAQSSTLFTKQGSTMDRNLFPCLQMPAATLQAFINISIAISMPIYDRILVPLARVLTKKTSGITTLQRIGLGMLFSFTCMVVAAITERKRLEIAFHHGLIDVAEATVPMSIWWLVPQYVLSGVADAFTVIGLQEFFYGQVPGGLKSLGIALYLSILGVGSFISSFLIFVIEKASSSSGDSWFPNNLNRGHLDYFYWFLAFLSIIGMISYVYCAMSYVYNRGMAI